MARPTLLSDERRERIERAYKGADERIFCHPERGTIYNADTFKEKLDAALSAAEVEGRVRPFHDLRHTAITHDAASGSSASAVMAKAGHRNMATTRTYLHLAGRLPRGGRAARRTASRSGRASRKFY